MKKSQCTEEQIAWALHQHEGGMSVAEVTRRLRGLTVVDHFSRVSPAMEVRRRDTGYDVVRTLERATLEYGVPCTMRGQTMAPSSYRKRSTCGRMPTG